MNRRAPITPFIHEQQPVAMFDSSAIARLATGELNFAAGTSLPPFEIESYDSKGVRQFVSVNPYQQGSYSSTQAMGARHIDGVSLTHVSIVEAIQIDQKTTETQIQQCVLKGFAADAHGDNPLPLWTYTVNECVSVVDDTPTRIALSDDGTTVAMLCFTNSTLPVYGSKGAYVDKTKGNVITTVQLHVLDAQTGKILSAYSPTNIPMDKIFIRSLSLSMHGDYIAFVNWETIYVWQKMGGLRTEPFDAVTPMAAICPVGVFLIYGYTQTTIAKWDQTVNKYMPTLVLDGVYDGVQYYFETAVASVNGGGSHVDGCLSAIAWTNADFSVLRIDLYSMTSKTHFWTHITQPISDGQNLPRSLSMHYDYLSIAFWGSINSQDNSPTIVLFNEFSNQTIFSYQTPGSMWMSDIVVEREAITNQTVVRDTVFLNAGGKHVHANIQGNGGDYYAFKMTYMHPAQK
eukprot:TRINITY_DN10472_c0_g1_i1.p1 TRINITY_DN10472_c0_g1~~TRINITY_DN10472_c0_g1_i1.p1  ORF type:complete len:536 (-),score=111.39 TRINITY_DN10472_c0_g1_i1:165-1541(-)